MNRNDFFDPIWLGALGGNPRQARAEQVGVGRNRVGIGSVTLGRGNQAWALVRSGTLTRVSHLG
jgi:hypothetical protein